MRLMMVLVLAGAAMAEQMPRDNGYRGIWYYNQPTKDKYVYKYSGGFATYPQQQSPIAIYSAKAGKTFFCYGGSTAGKQELLHMVSYFDHKTKTVPRPVVLVNKKTGDAHDNPVLAMDGAGHLWVFSNAHGTSRDSFVWRSDRPYDIDGWTLVKTTNFSYGHPRWVDRKGFFFLHTLYENGGRSLYWNTSADGVQWGEPSLLARMDLGHYQITAHDGARTATVFNYHPKPQGLNARTNLYYLETSDLGRTWKSADGRVVTPPLREVATPALVHDYAAEKKLVYLKNVEFGLDGRPVILFLTSKGWEPGPGSGPQEWKTARWNGKGWDIRGVTTSDHNYDFGSLYLEATGAWRIIAPTDPGPQPFMTGGDMVMWLSKDAGRRWTRVKQLTRAERFNHTYARKPVNAHPEFYALWADGDTHGPSESGLYFTDREGTGVWRLPVKMDGDVGRPVVVK
ncbi:MAG: BNR-4 repeat-containing protein [Acidobacteria bacterium]|nr:BNR-4 repeat-containing protein [Acidobacteriota bacterium]